MNNWFSESTLNDTVRSSFKYKALIHESQSDFQRIRIYDTYSLGRLLVLDDSAMISDKDEFIYHEVITHIPILVQEQTKNVLIIGGGDGGAIRELVKYKSIKSIELVEIDSAVVDISREFFPHVASGLNDQRVKIHYTDGVEFINNCEKKYDLIIVDSTDPIGPAVGLYEKKFYEVCREHLNENGIFMAQTETPLFDEYSISSIYDKLNETFPIVETICAPMLIYPGVYWTFSFCSLTEGITSFKENKLCEYGEFSSKLKWHNLDWHKSCFKLSNLFSASIDYKSSL